MKLSREEKKGLLRQARSRSNRRAFRAARESAHSRTFDEFIVALDEVQALRSGVHKERRFVAYKFIPL